MSGQHTHPDLADALTRVEAEYVTRADLDAALTALEERLRVTPAHEPPSEEPAFMYEVIRECRYDGAGWMPSPHSDAGDVAYVLDPLGSGETVARYHSTGRAENWHSDHIKEIEAHGFDEQTYIYSGGFLFPEGSVLSWPRWWIFRQWHNGNGSPGFSFQRPALSSISLIRRRVNLDGSENDETVARFAIEEGRWYDYSVLAIWKKDGTGRFQLRIDGQAVADYEGPTLKPDAGTLYGKNGGYQSRGETVSFARRLFIARSNVWDERLHDAAATGTGT